MVGLVSYSVKSRRVELEALNEQAKAKIAEENSKRLLQIVLKGRGDQYVNQSDSAIIERLFMEQTNPINKLITPRANSVQVSNTKNYDFLIWIDVPSFRLDEIKQVEYIDGL
ncbi:MAG: hypothetical protein IPP42_01265 [Saprospiraceae bacterium]|nr:hypothetical protein [Saprospiraceae bacterium]